MGLFSKLLKTAVPAVTGFLTGGPVGAAVGVAGSLIKDNAADIGGSLVGAKLDSMQAARDRVAQQSFNREQMAFTREENAKAREENRLLMERSATLGRHNFAFEREANLEDQATQYRRMVEAGTAEGFNPLTLLGAGGASGFGAGGGAVASSPYSLPGIGTPAVVAPLASNSVAANAVRDISDTLQNWQEQRTAEQKKEAELLQREAEKKAAGGVQRVVTSTRESNAEPSVVTEPGSSSHGYDEVPQVLRKGPAIEYVTQQLPKAPDGSVAEAVPGFLDVVAPDGSVTRIPHVEVEGEGVVVGSVIAAKDAIKNSSTLQAIRDGIPGIDTLGPLWSWSLNPQKGWPVEAGPKIPTRVPVPMSPLVRGGNLWLDYDRKENNYPKLTTRRNTPPGQRVTW